MTLLLLLGGGKAEAPETGISRIAVTQEHPPDPHAVVVRAPNGSVVGRWAEDEPLIENVVSGVTKSGEMPGGHKDFTCVLSRDPRLSYPDLSIFSSIEYQGPGGEIVWSGSLMRAPQTDGDHLVIGPEAAGDSSLLDDDEGVIGPGFIDGDLSKWGEPSTARRLQVSSAGIKLVANASVGWSKTGNKGEEGPAIVIDFGGVITESGKQSAGEVHYDAGNIPIGAILYWFKTLAGPEGGAEWHDTAAAGEDDLFTGAEIGTDHHAATNTAKPEQLTVAGNRQIFARLRSARDESGGGGAHLEDIHSWQYLKVLGRQGLTLQGTWPEVGFTAKQMLPIVAAIAGLRTTDESLEDDGFVIPQAWFPDPDPMSRVVAELTKYGLLDWFVFEDKLLQLRFPGTYGRRWQAYAGQSGLKNTGQDGTRVWDRITVQWQDVSGKSLTAGPPGSGAMFEDSRLQLTDPNNPAVAAGRPRKKLLVLKNVCNEGLAIKTAARFLEEASLLDHSGEATLTDHVMTEHGIWLPSSYVQPGDHIRFPDASDKSYRKVTAQPYTRASKTVTVSLDAPPEGLAALEERFNAKLIERGLGS